ncbi:unnamed protein product [Citrullus colocynthis]|uniref:Transmembrane protein n=1 Tax=Citrullus colocynthis TaxID=252529 RepID=A0ABP0YD47_9ROSI
MYSRSACKLKNSLSLSPRFSSYDCETHLPPPFSSTTLLPFDRGFVNRRRLVILVDSPTPTVARVLLSGFVLELLVSFVVVGGGRLNAISS